jgi:TolB-like protein
VPAARAAYENYLKVGKTRAAKDQIADRLEVLTLREVQLEAKAALARESQLANSAGPANAVAVMPFSFTGADTSLKPLERGFAELITTDLSRSPELTVVERMRLQALLDELKLQQTTNTEGSGIRAGHLLQVGKMVGGSIMQQGEELRANAIVTDVSTTRVGQPASDQETMNQLFTLEKNIVFELFNRLGVTLTTAQHDAIEQRPTRSLAAFLAYSRGLQAEDQGRFNDAGRLFDNAVRLDPNFGAAQQKSHEAKSAAAGANVNVTTVESSLRGTAEGAAVASAGVANMNTNAGTAVAMANGLNPSTAAGATSGVGSTSSQPTKDPSAGTGGDDVTTKTTKVTIVVHQPGTGKP